MPFLFILLYGNVRQAKVLWRSKSGLSRLGFTNSRTKTVVKATVDLTKNREDGTKGQLLFQRRTLLKATSLYFLKDLLTISVDSQLPSSFYSLEALYKGNQICFEKFRNKGLVKLDETYREKGLQVIAFPCNQFGNQEPDSSDVIRQKAYDRYHATFPIFDKVDVNGRSESPVYSYLKRASHTGDIEWNYVKFLVTSQEKIHRFGSLTDPLDLRSLIEKELVEIA
eukprot:jgi/Galph1/280/GphlegSOOS_G5101.1